MIFQPSISAHLLRQRAMTLLEMLVSVSIMVLIIFGLAATFNQTQRIFRAGMSQTDTLEGGRAALDLIRRDLEPSVMLRHLAANTPVMSIALENEGKVGPVTLLGTGGEQTENVLEKFFLMRQTIASQVSQQPAFTNYVGVGYRVLNLDTNTAAINSFPGLVGTLYRYSSANLLPPTQFGFRQGVPPLLMSGFVLADGGTTYKPANLIQLGYLNRVIEGVVHFRVNLYDSGGRQIIFSTPDSLAIFAQKGTTAYSFFQSGNVPVPAFVEIELGILDPPVLEQFKAKFVQGPGKLSDQVSFLESHTGNIRYYRSQIPLRTYLTQ